MLGVSKFELHLRENRNLPSHSALGLIATIHKFALDVLLPIRLHCQPIEKRYFGVLALPLY